MIKNKSGREVSFKESMKELFSLAESAKISLSNYPSVSRLKTLQGEEEGIAFDQVNQEQSQLLKALNEKGAHQNVKEFIQTSKRLRYSQIAQHALIDHLLFLANRNGISDQNYPNLKSYLNNLKKFNDLDASKLLDELEVLEDESYSGILTTQNSRRLRAIDRYVGLLSKAYNVQLSSNEYALYSDNKKDFPVDGWLGFVNRRLAELRYFDNMIPYHSYLEEGEKGLTEFYSLVDKRDEAFLANTQHIMSGQNKQVAALIAGGYHTQNLTKLLREEGYSYVVLVPRVTQETNHDRYEELLFAGFDKSKRLEGSPSRSQFRQRGFLRNGNFRITALKGSGHLSVVAARLPGLKKTLKALQGTRELNDERFTADLPVDGARAASNKNPELAALLDELKEHQTYTPQGKTPEAELGSVYQKMDNFWLTESVAAYSLRSDKTVEMLPGLYRFHEKLDDGRLRILARGISYLVDAKANEKFAPVRNLQKEAVESLDRTGGWKIRVPFDIEDDAKRERIREILMEFYEAGMIASFKFRDGKRVSPDLEEHAKKAGGEKGEDATVYIGDGHRARLIANYLESQLKDSVLDEPLKNNDIPMSEEGFITGRFDAMGDHDFRDELADWPLDGGIQGIRGFWGVYSIDEVRDKSVKLLTDRYGRFFSAGFEKLKPKKKKPSLPPAPPTPPGRSSSKSTKQPATAKYKVPLPPHIVKQRLRALGESYRRAYLVAERPGPPSREYGDALREHVNLYNEAQTLGLGDQMDAYEPKNIVRARKTAPRKKPLVRPSTAPAISGVRLAEESFKLEKLSVSALDDLRKRDPVLSALTNNGLRFDKNSRYPLKVDGTKLVIIQRSGSSALALYPAVLAEKSMGELPILSPMAASALGRVESLGRLPSAGNPAVLNGALDSANFDVRSMRTAANRIVAKLSQHQDLPVVVVYHGARLTDAEPAVIEALGQVIQDMKRLNIFLQIEEDRSNISASIGHLTDPLIANTAPGSMPHVLKPGQARSFIEEGAIPNFALHTLVMAYLARANKLGLSGLDIEEDIGIAIRNNFERKVPVKVLTLMTGIKTLADARQVLETLQQYVAKGLAHYDDFIAAAKIVSEAIDSSA